MSTATVTVGPVTPGKADTVTLVANYIPAEEPSGGPNFYEWDPSVLYEIHVHNGNGANDIIQGAVRAAASGVWQAPVDLSVTGQSAFGARVASDPQGNAAAVWDRSSGKPV